MGILGQLQRSGGDWRDLQSEMVELASRAELLAGLVDDLAADRSDAHHLVAADLLPSPGAALVTTIAQHMEALMDHIGVLTGDTLHEQYAQARGAYRQMIIDQNRDANVTARLRELRELVEDASPGRLVTTQARRYAETHGDEITAADRTIRDAFKQLEGVYSTLVAEGE